MKLFIFTSGSFLHFHQLVNSNSVWRTFSSSTLLVKMFDTLGGIIFIHPLRSTILYSLS
nr:MAG TPA: hypothetical protein [Caudoviricetes sp.]DAZ68177.1 MAG TPA: hypothetical protein [Caudoviricetes sp.]